MTYRSSMRVSIQQNLQYYHVAYRHFPDATGVSPGHGLDTTIGRERPHVETWRARGW